MQALALEYSRANGLAEVVVLPFETHDELCKSDRRSVECRIEGLVVEACRIQMVEEVKKAQQTYAVLPCSP